MPCDIVFECIGIIHNGERLILSADGYGNTYNYGNGSIFVNKEDAILYIKKPLLNKESLLKYLKGLKDNQYSEIKSESTEIIFNVYDNLIEDIERLFT